MVSMHMNINDHSSCRLLLSLFHMQICLKTPKYYYYYHYYVPSRPVPSHVPGPAAGLAEPMAMTMGSETMVM